MSKLLVILAACALLIGVTPLAFAGNGPGGTVTCPDHDNDGICNGQDPDYAPGDGCPNPACPDADGDGICNGQDPDYAPAGRGPRAERGEQADAPWRFMNLFRWFGPTF